MFKIENRRHNIQDDSISRLFLIKNETMKAVTGIIIDLCVIIANIIHNNRYLSLEEKLTEKNRKAKEVLARIALLP